MCGLEFVEADSGGGKIPGEYKQMTGLLGKLYTANGLNGILMSDDWD
jgi:hypothetical protein